MVELDSLFRPDLVFTELSGVDTRSVLHELSERIAETGIVEDGERLHSRLLEREELGSTGIGDGVAVPHCKLAELSRIVVAIGIAPDGVRFDAVDGEPVRLFVLVVSPEEEPAAHLQCLAAVSRWAKSDENTERILALDDPREIYESMVEGDA